MNNDKQANFTLIQLLQAESDGKTLLDALEAYTNSHNYPLSAVASIVRDIKHDPSPRFTNGSHKEPTDIFFNELNAKLIFGEANFNRAEWSSYALLAVVSLRTTAILGQAPFRFFLYWNVILRAWTLFARFDTDKLFDFIAELKRLDISGTFAPESFRLVELRIRILAVRNQALQLGTYLWDEWPKGCDTLGVFGDSEDLIQLWLEPILNDLVAIEQGRLTEWVRSSIGPNTSS